MEDHHQEVHGIVKMILFVGCKGLCEVFKENFSKINQAVEIVYSSVEDFEQTLENYRMTWTMIIIPGSCEKVQEMLSFARKRCGTKPVLYEGSVDGRINFEAMLRDVSLQ